VPNDAHGRQISFLAPNSTECLLVFSDDLYSSILKYSFYQKKSLFTRERGTGVQKQLLDGKKWKSKEGMLIPRQLR